MIDAVHARFRATDFEEWPDEARKAAFARPMVNIDVPRKPNGSLIADPQHLPDALPGDAFAKLGIKSWQETGRLRSIPSDVSLRDSIAARLASPTGQQLLTAEVWFAQDRPVRLHLFPWEDMSAVSEARVLCTSRGARLSSRCLRGSSSEYFHGRTTQVTEYAAWLAEQFGIGSCILQFAVRADDRLGLIDVNPALSPADIAQLE